MHMKQLEEYKPYSMNSEHTQHHQTQHQCFFEDFLEYSTQFHFLIVSLTLAHFEMFVTLQYHCLPPRD